MYQDHAGEVAARLEAGLAHALPAMGEVARAAVQQTMRTGYAAPVVKTGALMQDVQWEADARTLRIGNTLPYAAPVHDGTLYVPARPYLTDGLASATAAMADRCREALAAAMADD